MEILKIFTEGWSEYVNDKFSSICLSSLVLPALCQERCQENFIIKWIDVHCHYDSILTEQFSQMHQDPKLILLFGTLFCGVDILLYIPRTSPILYTPHRLHHYRSKTIKEDDIINFLFLSMLRFIDLTRM